MAKVPFKSGEQNQGVLFPPHVIDLLPFNSAAPLVNEIVDQLDISPLMKTYKGGGTSSYHPRMMLKIIFMGYLNNTFSCRKIANMVCVNVEYMWLAGMQRPDFRTINNFRSQRLKGVINMLFTQVVLMLNDMGYLNLKESFIDGTKIESKANRYTFVWRKSVEKHKSNLERKILAILELIDEGIAQDYKDDNDEFTGFDSSELKKRIKQINADNLNKEQKKEFKQLEGKMLDKLEEYEKHLETMGERNSYSKTDPDATFMRMKEDAMNNGQTKPGYNLQIDTSNQFIANYALYPKPNDTHTFIPFMNQRIGMFGFAPDESCADAGYGSEENYNYMESHNITPYVKFNYFHKEQKRAYRNNIFLVGNLFYNPIGDYLVCPMGQQMHHCGTKIKHTGNGTVSETSIYESINCNGCNMRGQCHKAAGNRRVEINHNLDRHKQKVREILTSEEGLKRRSRRPIEPEAVFGQIKYNMGYKRFRHFGKALANMDFGLLAIAFNLKKLHKMRQLALKTLILYYAVLKLQITERVIEKYALAEENFKLAVA